MSSPEIERLRPFEHLWLFMAHTKLLPRPGDFVAQYMGEDPVLVVRDPASRLRVFLNRCRHRGVVLCPFDRGNARFFTCSFHGWTYALDGALMSLQDRGSQAIPVASDRWNLIEAPRVATCGQFAFASWDADAVPLDDFLGPLAGQLAADFGHSGPAGLIPEPTRQRIAIEQAWDGGASGWQVEKEDSLQIVGSLPGFRMLEAARIPSSLALEQWHPRGPHQIESWLQVLVDSQLSGPARQQATREWLRLHASAGAVLAEEDYGLDYRLMTNPNS